MQHATHNAACINHAALLHTQCRCCNIALALGPLFNVAWWCGVHGPRSHLEEHCILQLLMGDAWHVVKRKAICANRGTPLWFVQGMLFYFMNIVLSLVSRD